MLPSVFSAEDEYTGVDLDDCIRDNGTIKEWGQAIIDRLSSYTEISPSQQGVKIWVKGSKSGDRCRREYKDGQIEMYDHARFFCVTGQIIAGPSPAIEYRQGQLDQLYAEVF